MSRVRLVAYRKKETLAQGTVNGNVAATTGLATIPMSFTSGVATDFYFVGDTILNNETQVLGVIDSVTASSIVLAGLNFAVSTNDTLKILRTNTYNLDLQEQPNISLNFQFAESAPEIDLTLKPFTKTSPCWVLAFVGDKFLDLFTTSLTASAFPCS